MNPSEPSSSPESSEPTSSTRRNLLLTGAGLAACGIGALAGYAWLQRDHSPVNNSATAKLWTESFTTLDGSSTTLSPYRGKTVIANFWATWCGPCREEMPDFVKAQTEFAAKGLQFVGIAIDRKPAVERFMKELAINYPIVLGDVAWLEAVKTMGNPQGVLPFTLVFSPKGELMLTRVGKLKYSEISSIVS